MANYNASSEKGVVNLGKYFSNVVQLAINFSNNPEAPEIADARETKNHIFNWPKTINMDF